MPVQRVDDVGPQCWRSATLKNSLFLADLFLRLRRCCAVIQLLQLTRKQVNFFEVAASLLSLVVSCISRHQWTSSPAGSAA